VTGVAEEGEVVVAGVAEEGEVVVAGVMVPRWQRTGRPWAWSRWRPAPRACRSGGRGRGHRGGQCASADRLPSTESGSARGRACTSRFGVM
jgi:hypothetical protein